MSEFTEAYYLRSNDTEDAVRLLKSAALKGYVYPARDGWVAFVANTSPIFKFSEKLRTANSGILLQFINAEDYGWGFELCMDKNTVCSFSCMFNEEMYETGMEEEDMYEIERRFSAEGFEGLLKAEKRFRMLEKYFIEDYKAQELMDAYDFTENLGLYFSDWISYHYAELEDGRLGKYGEYENLVLVKVE